MADGREGVLVVGELRSGYGLEAGLPAGAHDQVVQGEVAGGRGEPQRQPGEPGQVDGFVCGEVVAGRQRGQ